METITGYEIRKDGYIEENGKEHYDTQVYEAKTKKECIEYAVKNNLNPDEHFIQAVGFEIIHGLKVPSSIGEIEYLNILLNTHGN